MQKRRVGTISMAITLIAFGVILSIAQFKKVSAMNLAIKFWPAILLILGGEILWYSYKHKEEDVVIKYDIFSIFIILLIVVANLGISALIETGLMSKVRSMVSTETFTFNIPYKESEVGSEIEKIIIDTPSNSNVTIRPNRANKISFAGSVGVTTDSEEKVDKLFKNEFVNINSSGNTLYISFKDSLNCGDNICNVHFHGLNISLPENKKVELSGGSELKLIGDSIKNDWIIDNMNKIKIRLGKSSDLKINASTNYEGALGGNVKWNISKENSGSEAENIKGEFVYGKGSNNIHILNCDDIIVDKLE